MLLPNTCKLHSLSLHRALFKPVQALLHLKGRLVPIQMYNLCMIVNVEFLYFALFFANRFINNPPETDQLPFPSHINICSNYLLVINVLLKNILG